MNCLYPDCARPVGSRGLCRNHYVTLARLVKGGETTWEDQIKAGRCLGGHQGPRRGSPVSKWFLAGAVIDPAPDGAQKKWNGKRKK